MKTKCLLAALLVAATCTFAGAQVRFGLKAGAAWHDMTSADNDNVNPSSRVSPVAGIVVEWTMLDGGLCLESGLSYDHHSVRFSKEDISHFRSDYISIPVYIKYKYNIPSLRGKIAPFVLSGPSFSARMNKADDSDPAKYAKMVVRWEAGLGIEIGYHFQISGTFCKSLNKSVTDVVPFPSMGAMLDPATRVALRDKNWTITAAYLF